MMRLDHAVAVIGGADGPTAIYVASSFHWGRWALFMAAVVVIGLLLWHKRRS